MSATVTPTQPADQQLQPKKYELPEVVTRRGVNEAQWRTLMGSLFPGAKSESVVMVIDYCQARKLDPMKKPCHIVPIKVKNAQSGEYEWRDVVMAGIYEYRTTAMRTGNYLGHSKPEYGAVAEIFGVEAPDWCEMTFYRRATNGDRIEFPVRVYFKEACATKFDKEKKVHTANERWMKAPIQMLTKCAEAAGLREAFPDEFGGEATAEEMTGRDYVDADVVQTQPIKAAERISEQAGKTTPSPESSQAPASEEKKPAEPATVTESTGQPGTVGEKGTSGAAVNTPTILNVGTITAITEHGASFVLELNTGFKCSSKDVALKTAATNLKAANRIVELVTTAHAQPDKYMARLDEIIPVASE